MTSGQSAPSDGGGLRSTHITATKGHPQIPKGPGHKVTLLIRTREARKFPLTETEEMKRDATGLLWKDAFSYFAQNLN